MATIEIVLEMTGAGTDDDPTGPPSSTELFASWGWTPVPGTVSIRMLEDRGDSTGLFLVTGPQSLIQAIEASA